MEATGMKTGKLSLKAEDLRVESFRVDERGAGRGTVYGHDCQTYSCGGTCGASPPESNVAPPGAIRPTQNDDTCLICCI
jgi:hypothetical protein